MPNENTAEPGDAQVTHIRIERGTVAMGTDGPLGTVEQIVMDENTGELRALIVRRDDSSVNASEVEISAAHVVPGIAGGRELNLDIGSADIRAHPELAPRYQPERYVPVHEEVVLPSSVAGGEAMYTERPVVSEISGNAAHVVVASARSASQATAAPVVSGDTEVADAAELQDEATPDETPTLVLRAQRSMTDRERELDEPAPPVDLELPITPDLVAATAAEVPYSDTSATDDTIDVPPVEARDVAPDLATSNSSSNEESLEEAEHVAASQPQDATEVQVSDPWPTSEPAGDDGPKDDIYSSDDDVEGPYLQTLRPMGDSIWVAVPASAAEEQWMPERNWGNYDVNRFRRGNTLGMMLGAGLGLAAVGGAIVLLRRAGARKDTSARQTAATASRSARSLARTAQKRATTAREAVPTVLENAASTARRVRRTANDWPGRWRWFRRGVRVGAAVAVPLARISRSRQPVEHADRRQPAATMR